jgi:hypothetical protein
MIKDLYINQINLKKITINQKIANTNNKILKVNNKNMLKIIKIKIINNYNVQIFRILNI